MSRRRQFDADLDEEMRLHCELREQEQIERGLSPKEAHYAAQRRFGNQLVLREESRDVWGWNWLETLLQDARYGARQLHRNQVGRGGRASSDSYSYYSLLVVPCTCLSRSLPVEGVDFCHACVAQN